MKVREIMNQSPFCIEQNATVLEAAQKMDRAECGILPVGQPDHIVGVITDRDIVIRAVTNEKDPHTTTVQEIMTTNLCKCKEEDNLKEAAHKMGQNHAGRILVFNENKELTGILTFGHILRNLQNKSELNKIVEEAAMV